MKSESMTGEALGLQILEGLKDIKLGRFRVTLSPAKIAREKLAMTQVEFGKLMGVSPRTVEGWEQGLKKPSGAAMSLIAIASARPDVVREVLPA